MTASELLVWVLFCGVVAAAIKIEIDLHRMDKDWLKENKDGEN